MIARYWKTIVTTTCTLNTPYNVRDILNRELFFICEYSTDHIDSSDLSLLTIIIRIYKDQGLGSQDELN